MKNRPFLKHLKKHTLTCAVILSMAAHGAGFYFTSHWSFLPDPPIISAKTTVKIKNVLVKIEKPLEKTPEPKETHDRVEPSLQAQLENPVAQKVAEASPMPFHESLPRTSNFFLKARTPAPDTVSDQVPQSIKMVQREISASTLISQSRIPSRQESPGPHKPERRIMDHQLTKPDFPAPQPRQASPATAVAEVLPAPALKNSVTGSEKRTGIPGLNPAVRHHPRTLTAEEAGISRQPAVLLAQTTQERPAVPPQIPFAKNPEPIGEVIGKTPARHKSAGSRETNMRATRVQERKPGNKDRDLIAPYSPVPPVPRNYLPSFANVSEPLLMTAIAAGFPEVTLDTENQSASDARMASTKLNENSQELSAEFLGEVKNNFSSQVWNRIAQFKHYPRIARKRGFEGQPVIAFTLANNGELLDIFIEKASSYKILDQAALQAVQAASPYPSIPKLLNLESIRFKLPISFILEEP